MDWLVFLEAGATGGSDSVSRLTNAKSGNLPSPSVWPRKNSAWGSNLLVASIGSTVGEGGPQEGDLNLTGGGFDTNIDVKVFYDATGSKNPSGDPNWFYYYKDASGGGAYTYDNAGNSHTRAGAGIAAIKIGNEAYSGDFYCVTDNNGPNGRLRYLRDSNPATKYYPAFCGVLAHETQHATNEVPAMTNGDADGDYLPTAFENGTSNTDPANANSASPFVDDGEVYANGPIEQAAVAGADKSVDWAVPGSQW